MKFFHRVKCKWQYEEQALSYPLSGQVRNKYVQLAQGSDPTLLAQHWQHSLSHEKDPGFGRDPGLKKIFISLAN